MAKKTAHKSKSATSHGSQGKGSGHAASSGNKSSGTGVSTGTKKKSGCFPKLLTLFVPFLAIGAFFLLNS